MAELFLARPMNVASNESVVVIKRLLPHMADDPYFNAMFIDEAKLTARLTHPNIIETFEFGRYEDELFMVMEYIDGLDTLAVLRECAHRKVRVPTEIAVHIVHEVLDALDFAHSQVDENGQPLCVVHRDISPSNVLLSRRGHVKLVDFGIAQASKQSHETKDGTLKGKYGYMSPEQVMDQEIDARSDIFSVGVVLTEMLTGRRLFAAPTELDVLLMVRDVRLDRLDKYGSHIGLDLDRILRKSLSKSPKDRFSSAGAFRDALAEWMFLHHHRVTPMTVARIVNSLYDDAWERKRKQYVEADARRAVMMAGMGSRKGAGSAPMPVAGMHFGDEASQADGIPLGQSTGTNESVSVAVSMGESMSVAVSIGENAPALASGSASAPVSVSAPASASRAAPAPASRSAPAPRSAPLSAPAPRSAPLSASASRSAPASDDAENATADQLYMDNAITHYIGGIPVTPVGDESAVTIDMADVLTAKQDPAAPKDFMTEEKAIKLDTRSFASVEAALEALESARDFDDSEVSHVESRMPGQMPSGAAQVAELVADEPDDTGDFGETPPISVLYRLATSRATGLLVASVGGIRKEVYFREGIPEYVTSNVAKELFGEYLRRAGVLTEGELSMALAMMPHYHGKLGDTLVGLGLLKPLEVFRHLSRQVRDKLIDVCTWPKGTFEWYGGRLNPRDAFPLDINAYEVLGAGALSLSTDMIDEWLDKYTDTCKPRIVSRRLSPAVFQVGGIMHDVWERLDGRRTLKDFFAYFEKKNQAARAIRVLYLLAHTGIVKM